MLNTKGVAGRGNKETLRRQHSSHSISRVPTPYHLSKAWNLSLSPQVALLAKDNERKEALAALATRDTALHAAREELQALREQLATSEAKVTELGAQAAMFSRTLKQAQTGKVPPPPQRQDWV